MFVQLYCKNTLKTNCLKIKNLLLQLNYINTERKTHFVKTLLLIFKLPIAF